MSKKNDQEFSYHYNPAYFYEKRFEVSEKPFEIDTDHVTDFEKISASLKEVIANSLGDINFNRQILEEKKELRSENLDKAIIGAKSVPEELKHENKVKEEDAAITAPTTKLVDKTPGKLKATNTVKEEEKKEEKQMPPVNNPVEIVKKNESQMKTIPQINNVVVPNLDSFCFDTWQSLSSLRLWPQNEPEKYQYIKILLEECQEAEFTYAKTFWNEVNNPDENGPAIPQPKLDYLNIVYIVVYAILWHYGFKKPELLDHIIKGLESGKSEFFPRIAGYSCDDIQIIKKTLKELAALGLRTHKKYYHFEEDINEEYQSNVEELFFNAETCKTRPEVTSGLVNLGIFITEVYKSNFKNESLLQNDSGIPEDIFIMLNAISDAFRINIDFGFIKYNINPEEESHIKWATFTPFQKKLISKITLFMGSAYLHAGILCFTRILDPVHGPFNLSHISDEIKKLK